MKQLFILLLFTKSFIAFAQSDTAKVAITLVDTAYSTNNNFEVKEGYIIDGYWITQGEKKDTSVFVTKYFGAIPARLKVIQAVTVNEFRYGDIRD